MHLLELARIKQAEREAEISARRHHSTPGPRHPVVDREPARPLELEHPAPVRRSLPSPTR